MQNIINKNIISELGIDLLPEAKQIEMLEQVGRIVFQGVLISALEIMDEKSKDEFEKVLDKGVGADEVIEFLKLNLPNFNEIVEKQVVKIKQQSLDFINDVE